MHGTCNEKEQFITVHPYPYPYPYAIVRIAPDMHPKRMASKPFLKVPAQVDNKTVVVSTIPF